MLARLCCKVTLEPNKSMFSVATCKAIHDLDPSVTTRKRAAIRRRVYSVPYPNYLWHLDTNHKLIRWRFVTHHCIDCFSCLITFCHCSTNNKTETVFLSFNEVIHMYGRPQWVCSDHGGENVLVWRDMTSAWGEDAGSVIIRSRYLISFQVRILWPRKGGCSWPSERDRPILSSLSTYGDWRRISQSLFLLITITRFWRKLNSSPIDEPGNWCVKG